MGGKKKVKRATTRQLDVTQSARLGNVDTTGGKTPAVSIMTDNMAKNVVNEPTFLPCTTVLDQDNCEISPESIASTTNEICADTAVLASRTEEGVLETSLDTAGIDSSPMNCKNIARCEIETSGLDHGKAANSPTQAEGLQRLTEKEHSSLGSSFEVVEIQDKISDVVLDDEVLDECEGFLLKLHIVCVIF